MVATYSINVSVNDTSNNILWGILNITVTNTVPSTGGGGSTGSVAPDTESTTLSTLTADSDVIQLEGGEVFTVGVLAFLIYRWSKKKRK